MLRGMLGVPLHRHSLLREVWGASPLGGHSVCHVIVIGKTENSNCNFKKARSERHSIEIERVACITGWLKVAYPTSTPNILS